MAVPRQDGRPGGRWRGRLLALALLALAVGPLLALRIGSPPGPEHPVALMAPAPAAEPPTTAAADPAQGEGAPRLGAPGLEAEGPGAPEDEITAPAPATRQPGAPPAPPATAGTDLHPAAGTGVVARPFARPAPPAGPERWSGIPACPRDRITGGQYNRCLYEATRTSEQAMEAALTHAFSVIEARGDLQGTQRNRWKTMLDEAQSRFLLFRNLDCQGVAPFEGPRGIGNFEQRALCLIDANSRRAAELRARYIASAPAAAAAGPQGPQDRPGTWTHAVPPALD